ncbi:hypothetical protein EBZ39_07525 [bacterium]|nr:hypothetical protein [bacterium]
MQSISYTVPRNGMATDFARSEESLEYSPDLRNRFINITGAAERRRGFSRLLPQVPGSPNLTRFHEYIAEDGSIVNMASTDTGTLYRYNGTTWTAVVTGKGNGRILSIQSGNSMLFCNGTSRNFITKDGGLTFQDAVARIVEGKAAAGSNATTLQDSNVSNYTNLFAANNDIVWNVTKNAYGAVTNIATATITHTSIGTAGKGSGAATSNQAPGDAYVLIDTVALNIIPVGTNTGIFDNIATAGSGTNSTTIAVSGVNFSTTKIRVGDYIINTTQNAVMRVSAVGTNLTVPTVTGQTSGDSLVFLKDAMPISNYLHINWGRGYLFDVRDPNKIRITAKDDIQDLTTFQNTLDASAYNFGQLQPIGDTLISMTTYQRFLVVAGKRYVYVFSGVDPIQDTSTSVVSFAPVIVYPQGLVSRFGIISNGNELMFVNPDGLLNASVGSNNNSLVSGNLSEVIKSRVRSQIAQTAADDIQVIFYPRRNWMMFKIGGIIYNFNQTSVANLDGTLRSGGTWSYFDGTYANMNHYYVRQNGDLVACGSNGGVWLMDDGFSDNGDIITTSMEFPYVRLEDPQRSVRIKSVKYIRFNFESGGSITYNIVANAGFDNLSKDTVSVTSTGGGVIGQAVVGTTPIGGSGVQLAKTPLRVRGEEAKIIITSSSLSGPDVVSGFTLYGEVGGIR